MWINIIQNSLYKLMGKTVQPENIRKSENQVSEKLLENKMNIKIIPYLWFQNLHLKRGTIR